MTSTRIRLIGDYFNVGINDYLEIAEGVVVPLNFGISDIRDLTSKTGSFSKSIKVAGTKHNNQVFDFIFDVNAVTLDFNINTKQQCLIEQDGEIVLDNAIMQLIDVEKVSTGMGDDEQIVYTISVKDTVSELFTDIGNKLLTNLDFSDLNHIYQASDVIASFDHVKDDGYKYILPIADDNSYLLKEMKPAIYVWQYLNRIFAQSGYSYTFDEMQTIGVDKLLIPYNGGKSRVSELVQIESEVIAEETAVQEVVGVLTFNKLDITTEISDVNGYYNPTISQYTSPFLVAPPTNLDYQVTIDFDLIIRNNELVSIYPNDTFQFRPYLSVINGAVDVGLINCFSTVVNTPFIINVAGFTELSPFNNVVTGDTVASSGVNNLTISCSNIAIADVLELGASIITTSSIDFYRLSDNAPANVDFVVRVNSIKIRIVPSGENLGFSFPVVMNDFVPANIKQSDFLKSIFTMFNIFAIPNIDDPKNIILQTRDEFYDIGNVNDFTKKLCKDLPHTIIFLPELTAKKLTMSYSNDSDIFNTAYLKNVNETYGQVSYNFDNEYIKNEVRQTILFGASPFVSSPFGAIVMAINGSEPKTSPRIVYDGGKYPCGYYNIYDAQYQWLSVNVYPYVGHFSSPQNAEKDFNFGICDYYFDNNYGNIPYNNLSNTYWRRTMAQINEGKLYSVYLNLTSYDVANLRLNDKIYLDRSYWSINKIIDYDANSNAPTKVELLSIDQETALPSFKIKKPKKPSKWDAGVAVPIKNTIKLRNQSLTSDSSSGDIVSLGKGNKIQGNVKNALIIGDNQTVTEDGIYTPKLFVNGGQNYTPTLSMKGIINQVGSSAPTLATVFDDFEMVATRVSSGVYQLTTTNLYLGVVTCEMTQGKSTLGLIAIAKISNSVVEIRTIDATGVLADTLITDSTIHIQSWQIK